MKKKKVLIFIITAAVMAVLCSITVFADGEVANAVSNTWTIASMVSLSGLLRQFYSAVCCFD